MTGKYSTTLACCLSIALGLFCNSCAAGRSASLTPGKPQVLPTKKEGAPTSPAMGTGSVVGLLFDENEQIPFADREIYLAKIGKITSLIESRPFYYAEVDPNRDPRCFTDEQGRFRFDNIPVGQYSLVVRHPNLVMEQLYSGVTRSNILVDIKANETINFSTIRIVFAHKEL